MNCLEELTESEMDCVSGGVAPAWAAIGAVSVYMTAIDAAWDFGAGLGAGLYEAVHLE